MIGAWLFAAPMVLAGCGSDEHCERLCQFLGDCTDAELPEDCAARCEDDMDNESDECLDALDELVECLDDNEGCGALDVCAPQARELDDEC